mgnify:CR=1 FL=1
MAVSADEVACVPAGFECGGSSMQYPVICLVWTDDKVAVCVVAGVLISVMDLRAKWEAMTKDALGEQDVLVGQPHSALHLDITLRVH